MSATTWKRARRLTLALTLGLTIVQLPTAAFADAPKNDDFEKAEALVPESPPSPPPTPTPPPVPSPPPTPDPQGSPSVPPVPSPEPPPTPQPQASPGDLPAMVREMDTSGATLQQDEPTPACGLDTIGKTVWFSYRPTDTTPSGALQVDTFGSDFDTIVAVWTGEKLSALTEVTCNNDAAASAQSVARFTAAIGTRYFFQVGGLEGAAGKLRFRLGAPSFGAISGQVTSDVIGSMRRVCVTAFTPDRPEIVAETETMKTGSYTLNGLPSGAYQVLFSDTCDASEDHRAEWYNNATARGGASEITVTAPNAVTGINARLDAFRLAVSKKGPGAGSVTSNLGGIDCGSTCSAVLSRSATVTLTAVPADATTFATWNGCDTVTGATCSVLMNRARSVVAHFNTTATAAPDTTITGGPTGTTTSHRAVFTFTSTAAAAAFECSLDGATFAPCASPSEQIVAPEGGHTFRVRAVDEVGNVDESPAEATWIVDAAGPAVSLQRPRAGLYAMDRAVNAPLPAPVVIGFATMEIRAIDLESGVSSFALLINGQAVDPSKITLTGDTYRTEFRPTTSGWHTITARATNASGKTTTVNAQIFGVPA